MKKLLLLSSAFVATIALFVACGDDVTEVTEVNEIHQEGIAVLDAGLELSKQKCDSANAGEMLFVTDSAMVFVCDGGTWVSLKGADGENGKNGVDGKPGEDGDDGDDGESCTAKPVKNEAGVEGLEVTCGKTVVGTIWNGKDGVDGDDGDDGESCTAKPVKNEAGVEGLEVTCGKTVVGTIWNGVDGNDGDNGDDGEGCEISREGNVLTITCGKSIETVDLDELIQISSSSEEGSSSSEDESSSSEEESSSSANESSSSVVFPDGVMPAGYYKTNCPEGHHCVEAASSTYLNSDITYGEILDTRDYQVYKVVTIGGQVWMAQNLNYAPDENQVHSLGDYAWSGCYGGKADSCAKYGRLYIWNMAMEACPDGWHLPSEGEWEALFRSVGGREVAGIKLKSKNGWNGEDSYGFAVLPAGYRDINGDFSNVGSGAYFWSSTEYGGGGAYREGFDYGRSDVDEYGDSKDDALSVRCLKDD